MSAQLPSVAQADHYDTVDFGQLVIALRRRAATIIIFTLVAATTAFVHVLFATPQFTARGMVYLGETQESDNSDSSGPVNLSAYSTQSDVETQIGLLTSGTIIERAVLESGLNTTLRPAGTPPLTFWRWRLFAHSNPAVFVPGKQDLQVVDATLPGRYSIVTGLKNTYRLYARGEIFSGHAPILVGVIGRPETVGRYSLTVRYAIPDHAENNNVEPTKAPEIRAGVVYDLDIVAPDILADSLPNGMLSITAGGTPEQPTQLATLQLRWHDPYQAKQFINQLMYDYIATQLQWKTEAASVTESFVTGQIARVAKKLASADEALSAFQAKTNIVDPQQNAQEAVQQMAQFQAQRASMLLQQQALRQLHDSFKSPAASVTPYLISETNDSVLSELTSSLSSALVKLRQLNTEYMPDEQDVYVQQAQVDELRRTIRDLVDNDLKQSTKNLEDMDNLIASYEDKLKEQPAEALKVAALKRTSDQLGQFYELLTEKAEQAQISKAATIIDTRVVTPSRLPHMATSPKATITIIGGALAGFFCGIIAVFLKHTLSGRFESEEQIRRTIKLPVYGTVPAQKMVGTGSNFFGANTHNSFSESFRLIKRNLGQYVKDRKATILLVISANERDGKTTVAANLAKTLADDGKRVAMLDCDFYLSRLQKLQEFENAPGLADWLATGGRPDLRCWPGESFWIIPAGAFPKRGGRLDEASFSGIISLLTEEFDYLVLDSPPLPIVSDGLVLGNFADVILSVISVKNTDRRMFDYHNELINGLGRPHGLIINGAESASYSETDAYFMGGTKKRKRFGWLIWH